MTRSGTILRQLVDVTKISLVFWSQTGARIRRNIHVHRDVNRLVVARNNQGDEPVFGGLSKRNSCGEETLFGDVKAAWTKNRTYKIYIYFPCIGCCIFRISSVDNGSRNEAQTTQRIKKIAD